jgi:hypothetical protein
LIPASPVARRVAIGLAGGTAVVLAAFVVAFSYHRLVAPAESWKELFDIGGEANVPTWWNATLLATVALAALVASSTELRPSPPPNSGRGGSLPRPGRC